MNRFFVLFILLLIPHAADAGDTPGDYALSYGDPNAPVTIVELMDYQCPACKAIHPQVVGIALAFSDIRLEVREVAILDKVSIIAAHAAMAAAHQDRREDLHRNLMVYRARLKEATVFEIARQSGLDEARLRADMAAFAQDFNAHLQDNLKIGLAHKMKGTPVFLINDEFLSGSDVNALIAAIERARARLGG